MENKENSDLKHPQKSAFSKQLFGIVISYNFEPKQRPPQTAFRRPKTDFKKALGGLRRAFGGIGQILKALERLLKFYKSLTPLDSLPYHHQHH